jgi:hypothetical protein
MRAEIDYHKIISTDYYSNLAATSPIVFWAVYVVLYLLEFVSQDVLWRLEVLSIFVSLVAVVFLAWRRHFFYAIYLRGVDVTGYIYSADAFKTGGSRVEYKYEYQGEKYCRGNALTHPVYFKRDFHDGEEVALRIDLENPKRAVIKDIYF